MTDGRIRGGGGRVDMAEMCAGIFGLAFGTFIFVAGISVMSSVDPFIVVSGGIGFLVGMFFIVTGLNLLME